MSTAVAATAFPFPSMPDQISAARARVADVLAGHPRADDVVLVASELAANAVRHADAAGDPVGFIVAIEEGPDRVVLHVADRGGVLTTFIPPPLRAVDDIPTWQTGGRGRAICVAIADAVNFGTTPCTHIHDDLGGLCCRAVFYTGSES